MDNILKARIKRNQFDVLAGDFYRDENSTIVNQFLKENKKVLIGIESTGGMYTLLGNECVYYKTDNGIKGEIYHSDFLKILSVNALNLGKNGDFEFVRINNKDSIWVMNVQTMNAMWNTILLLNS